MKVTVVRHGQTDGNLKGICDDNIFHNYPLNNTGISQAQNARDKLKNKNFEVIFVSQFARTNETATIINELHSKKMIIDERLNDRKTGYTNQPVELFETALINSNDFWNAKFCCGESFEEEKTRVFEFLGELKKTSNKEKEKNTYKNILIVTHMETIQIIKGYFDKLTNQEMWDFEVGNCENLEFEL